MPYSFDELINELKDADSVAVLTGAGISAEGGVPTFRGKGGIWDKTPIDEVATMSALKRDPVKVWNWFLEMRKTLKNCRPNLAHTSVVKLEKHFKKFTLITQNIDNYHQLAGSTDVVEIHGNAWWRKCIGCGKRQRDETLEYDKLPPECDCGKIMKPDVVFFGEQLPMNQLNRAFQAAKECDFLLVIGTSAVVVPAAMIPYHTHESGGKVVEFNTEPTPITEIAEISFFEKASVSVDRVAKTLDEIPC